MKRTKLINVRLQADDALKVQALKHRGVEISAIVRQAVRAEYARRLGSFSGRDAVRALQEIYSAHPATSQPKRNFDVHERRSFSAAMKRRVRQRLGK